MGDEGLRDFEAQQNTLADTLSEAIGVRTNGTALSGTPQQQERWKRAADFTTAIDVIRHHDLGRSVRRRSDSGISTVDLPEIGR